MTPARAEPLLSDDAAAWNVHADALLEAGDPRGQLVALQRGAPVLHHDLPDDQRALIEANEFLGPIERPRAHGLTWQRGYWHHLGSWSHRFGDDFWSAVFAHESARFLRDLSLRWMPPGTLLAVLRRHRPPLQRLHWHEREPSVDLDPYLAELPHLRALSLWLPCHFTAGPPAALRELSVNTGDDGEGLAPHLLRHAQAGGFVALRSLDVWGVGDLPWVAHLLEGCRPTSLALQGNVRGGVVKWLTQSSAFRTVTELTLKGFWPTDEQLEALIAALEGRGAKLTRYESTGHEPPPELRRRLEAVAEVAVITG